MPCCRWKRSDNDALIESESGTPYCGTCWQKWIVDQQQRVPLPKTKKSERPQTGATDANDLDVPDEQKGSLVDDDESLGELRGLQHLGKLYLVSQSRRLVFETERSKDGRLVCVGVLKCGERGNDEIRLYKVDFVASAPNFPFKASPEDHCETPMDAYEDIAPFLSFLAKCLGKEKSSLRIWDPYYCNGAVKEHFAKLGFRNVRNECEDFYRVLEDRRIPMYDCIVTNPPYSTEPIDHVHRLVKTLCQQQKPWFVVQPNYVYMKPYWEQYTSTKLMAPRPFFLTPHSPRKYKYKTPSGLRNIVSAQQLKTSPFVSMWFCWLGSEHTEQLYRWVASRGFSDSLPLTLACTEFFLPDSFKDSNDKTRRKPRKAKKRKTQTELAPAIDAEFVPCGKRKRRARPKT